jgi:hypothetical protein
MDRVGFDGSALDFVITSLDRATAVAPAESAKVVTKAAVNIKAGARRRISGHPHFPALPYAIDFDDVTVTSRGAYTEVGVNKDKRQGKLGNIPEYGAPAQNTPPTPYMRPSADEETPKFVVAMEVLAVKALGL